MKPSVSRTAHPPLKRLQLLYLRFVGNIDWHSNPNILMFLLESDKERIGNWMQDAACLVH